MRKKIISWIIPDVVKLVVRSGRQRKEESIQGRNGLDALFCNLGMTSKQTGKSAKNTVQGIPNLEKNEEINYSMNSIRNLIV